MLLKAFYSYCPSVKGSSRSFLPSNNESFANGEPCTSLDFQVLQKLDKVQRYRGTDYFPLAHYSCPCLKVASEFDMMRRFFEQSADVRIQVKGNCTGLLHEGCPFDRKLIKSHYIQQTSKPHPTNAPSLEEVPNGRLKLALLDKDKTWQTAQVPNLSCDILSTRSMLQSAQPGNICLSRVWFMSGEVGLKANNTGIVGCGKQ